MKTITITDPLTKESTDFVVIDRGNGEFTSMPKSVYDTLASESAKNSTES